MNSLKELNGVPLHLNTEGYVATMTGSCTRSLSTMRNASVRQHNTEIGVGCIEGKDQGSEPNQVFTEKKGYGLRLVGLQEPDSMGIGSYEADN